MLPAFLLAVREGMEIALLLGIVLGALKKTHRTNLNRTVWAGAASAAVLSGLAAFLLIGLGASLEGRAEETFEGITMLLAAAVLTWMIFWMQGQSRHIKGELEAGVRRATLQAGRGGLFILAFMAVIREGIELALFVTAASLASSPWAALLGSLAGLASAAFLGWALFAATVRLNMGQFFQVTSLLLILFAAGLVAHGIHELNEAGIVPAVVEHVWDVNGLLDEESAPGSMLQTLFGYNGNPSLTELIGYFTYLVLVLLAVWRVSYRKPVSQNA